MVKLCEYFTISNESKEVQKHWKIFGYCIKQKANITKGVCNNCIIKPKKKQKGLW